MTLFAAANIAEAQTPDAESARKVQLPQQVIPTGKEDASAAPAARSAVASRSAVQSVEQQKQQLIQELIEMTDESSDGLAPSLRPDGGTSVDLEGRFMSVAIAAPTAEGGYVVSCHMGEDAVAHAAHAHDGAGRQAPEAAAKPAVAQRQPGPTMLEEK